MDIHGHNGNPEMAITHTRDWLANVSRRKLPASALLVDVHRRFLGELPAIAQALHVHLTFFPCYFWKGGTVRRQDNWDCESIQVTEALAHPD